MPQSGEKVFGGIGRRVAPKKNDGLIGVDHERFVTVVQLACSVNLVHGGTVVATFQPFVVRAEAKLRDRGVGFDCINGLHQAGDVDTVNNFRHSVAPSAFGLTASVCDISERSIDYALREGPALACASSSLIHGAV